MGGALDEDRSKRRWLAGCLWLFYVIFYLCVLLIFNLIWDDKLLKSEQCVFQLGRLMGSTWLKGFLRASVFGSMFVKIHCWLFERPLGGPC